MCRKRTVYGKAKRKHRPSIVPNHPTNLTYIHENTRQLTSQPQLSIPHKDRTLNKFTAMTRPHFTHSSAKERISETNSLICSTYRIKQKSQTNTSILIKRYSRLQLIFIIHDIRITFHISIFILFLIPLLVFVLQN